ncbi:MAG: LysR family transcriptional regulator [Alphaproteobacteria bacterium]
MHKIRWNDLQFALALAEHGSLSSAARALDVNHATVLRRIASLEATLGVALFERPPGGYRVRPEVREFLETVAAMGRSADRLDRLIPAIGKGLEGSFRLTTTDSVAEVILPRHLLHLSNLHPKLNVELVVANTPIDMSRAEAEVTLRPARNMPDGLTGEKICDMAFRVYAHRDYLAAHPSAHYGDHRWLVGTPPLTRSPIGEWQDANLGDAVSFKADSFMTLARMAEAGLGPTMIPSFIARQSHTLVRAPQFPDETFTSFWVAAHHDLMRIEWVPAMIEFLAESIGRDRALLE